MWSTREPMIEPVPPMPTATTLGSLLAFGRSTVNASSRHGPPAAGRRRGNTAASSGVGRSIIRRTSDSSLVAAAKVDPTRAILFVVGVGAQQPQRVADAEQRRLAALDVRHDREARVLRDQLQPLDVHRREHERLACLLVPRASSANAAGCWRASATLTARAAAPGSVAALGVVGFTRLLSGELEGAFRCCGSPLQPPPGPSARTPGPRPCRVRRALGAAAAGRGPPAPRPSPRR